MLVPFRESELAMDGIWFKSGIGNWMSFGKAEEDLIVEYMRNIYKRKQNEENLFNAAGVETAKKFTWKATAERLLEVLND